MKIDAAIIQVQLLCIILLLAANLIVNASH